jgi:hypothetical protein
MNDPNDQGFICGRSLQDLDGHHWDVFYVDPDCAAGAGRRDAPHSTEPMICRL